MDDADRVRRLEAARASGRVSEELLNWAIVQARRAAASDAALSPAERLGLQLSAELDSWMRRRRLTQRAIAAPRSTVSRILKGLSVTLSSVADVADSLGCDVIVTFHPRLASDLKPLVSQLKPPVADGVGPVHRGGVSHSRDGGDFHP